MAVLMRSSCDIG